MKNTTTLAALLVTAFLVGCGSSSTDTPPTETAANAPVTAAPAGSPAAQPVPAPAEAGTAGVGKVTYTFKVEGMT